MNIPIRAAVALAVVLVTAFAAQAQQHSLDMSMHHGAGAPAKDARQVVRMPEPMRVHILENMRDHLLALQQIQHALSVAEFDRVAELAEQRLGMSAMQLHGAAEMSPMMPEGMRSIGGEMHRAASQLAVTAKDSSVTGDYKPVLAAMARVTQQCVSCHSAFRVQ